MSEVENPSAARPEWATAALASEFERLPRISVVESARRYWLLVLSSIVMFAAVGGFLAARRPSTYTAQARLNVGRLNISQPGAISGFAEAALTLASAYSRAITADGVVNPLARHFRTTPGAIRSRISATPVPTSPIVTVIATGSSASQAIELANAASGSLMSFIYQLGRSNPDGARLLRELKAADLAYQNALAAKQGAQQAKQSAQSATVPNPPLNVQQQHLAAAVEVAHVRVTSLEAAYQTSVGSQATSSLLQPLTSAYSASSNRSSTLQILVFAGVVIGAAVGLVLATLRTNRLARRTLTRAPWEFNASGPEAP